MMFSTKAEYGVRVMAHLAKRGSDDPISLGTIADAEGLPLAYLEHLVQRLRKAGLVESRRGAHGGYTLAREAGAISMAEVVRALEGEIAPIECITADADGVLVCSREHHENQEPCPTKFLWTRVQGSIVRTLTEMTLDDLVRPPVGGGPAKPDLLREAGGRTSKSERRAGGPAEVTRERMKATTV
jgi:Rrf2 family transcriptional regulator, cysteine metabolism repressor